MLFRSYSIFYTGSKAKAYNNLTRVVEIDIKSSAVILADYGSLTIAALSGQSDDIYATVSGDSASGVTILKGEVVNTFNGTTQVNIAGGAVITNTFGTVKITATGGNKSNAAYLDYSGLGLGSDTDVKTDVTSNNTVSVNIGTTGSTQARITGKNVTISALM